MAIRGSRIGKLYDTATFETFQVTPQNRLAFDACKKLAAREIHGVVLIGPAGTGKTHLCVATAREFGRIARPEVVDEVRVNVRDLMVRAAESGEVDESPVVLTEDEMKGEASIEYWPVLDLVSALRKEARGDDFPSVASRCCRCSLLVLDDFGQERATDFVFEELERIIDWRYRDQLSIAVSTNLSLDDLVAKYGNRAVSRWSQQCMVVEIGGRDMRIPRR